MRSHFRISLEGLLFHAPHGVYEGEALTGNGFEVDVFLDMDAGVPVSGLEDTVNYVQAYELIRSIMDGRQALLETLCQQIATALEGSFSGLQRLEIRIRKRTPAIPSFSGSVGVALVKSYDA
ncbi:dihydroneopterin aldolase [Flaviaesturariibacter flavus]|uniref:7,8-dihydroneopterin aldolase n=1 Tax=Flaviaesturariibacter flavus TaxID=2502780 RepID=A0A4R1BP01_9BACT|nr:dihydroneopterin aldolase [Flaviaesturariibacter flavus]TCJ19037.1 dihydroneopterin aldolase [Flaviaesturariibacter flavus]